jgi:malate synthase
VEQEMTQYTSIANIQVADCLFDFVNQDVLPELSIQAPAFWQAFSDVINELIDENKALLNTRDAIQGKIDAWHKAHKDENFSFTAYKAFLKSINYLVDEIDDFTISTANVDAEIATMAGPQLVVPVMNARFALNAVNARWGSLYDALYGTDVIPTNDGCDKTAQYNPKRGAKVIAFAKDFLDKVIPLKDGSHRNAVDYQLVEQQLIVTLQSGLQTPLENSDAFIGYQGSINLADTLLFKHNGLHFELVFERNNPIAKADLAGISDIIIESALTTIMDCEDSVAAVDASDKVIAYRNWLGLNKGNLSEEVTKGSSSFTRVMNQDRSYQTLNNTTVTLPGRSLMFVRNVGHLMTNNAILTKENHEVPEGIIDAMITSLIALHDINQTGRLQNSKQQSIYIVKPKMHGPDEVAFANKLFDKVEDALSLPRNTIKMGIMDEERRTTVNLKACIYAARERVVFINTGFLDRTGDEIHTSMEAGAMEPKGDIKNTPWISAYENNNVDIGLACGLSGKAQIGKGMWPIPDQMAAMLATKINHPLSGANTAWVPSPTAATLHALHYHQVDVFAVQEKIKQRKSASLDDILTFPVAKNTTWSEQEITDELDNNAQGILGYVVRWIDQGVGCSKVPDINNVGLMEDRATLRISSQHIANWLHHGICNKEQVMNSMMKMAAIVDQQNSADPLYQPMSKDLENNIAFKAACELVFSGTEQPNGYTEPVLHKYRLLKKTSH